VSAYASRRNRLLCAAGLISVVAVAACAVAGGLNASRGRRAPLANRYLPASLVGLIPSAKEIGRERHLVFLSSTCPACRQQLSAFASMGEGERQSLQLVLIGFDPGVGDVTVDRGRVERDLGRIPTPLHVVVDGENRILRVHAGVLSIEGLERWRLSAIEGAGGTCDGTKREKRGCL
jgi:hypothetical protein